MVRIVAIGLILVFWLSTLCFGQSGKPQNNLVHVKPDYDDSVSRTSADTYDPNLPKPADQLYVFWYLGRMISYPIDTAEAYLRSYISKLREPVKPVAVPASSIQQSNPFESVKWNSIPPAPPVAKERQ